MKIIKYFLLCGVMMIHVTNAKAQMEEIGRIFLTEKDTIPNGTAFVAGNRKAIYTCSHVATKDTLWFQNIGSNYIYRVSIKYNLPNYDVALLERTGGKQSKSLEFGDFEKIQPGDKIKYIGWDSRVKNFVLWYAIVSAKGSALTSENCRANFIEFEGEAIPGYSGGPVFDEDGKVIAMMREAWSKKGIKGGNTVHINRAFSIEFLRILDSEIKTSSNEKNSIHGTSLIDLINE